MPVSSYLLSTINTAAIAMGCWRPVVTKGLAGLPKPLVVKDRLKDPQVSLG